MNRRQITAIEGANPGLFNKNMERAREYVNLKGLKLSTVLTVDYIGGSYVWHASAAVVDLFSLMPIAPNKVSKANKIRVRNYLEKCWIESAAKIFIKAKPAALLIYFVI